MDDEKDFTALARDRGWSREQLGYIVLSEKGTSYDLDEFLQFSFEEGVFC